MKIGILTYTSNFNLGTFLQAYSVLNLVQKVYPDANVEIINHHDKIKYEDVGYDKLNLRLKHFVLPKSLLRHIKRQNAYRTAQLKHLKFKPQDGFFSESYNDAMDEIEKLGYDKIFVGSDTILNFYKWDMESNSIPVYWLSPELNAQKFMMAASIGTNLSVEDLSSKQKEEVSASLRGFDKYGIRDSFTEKFIIDVNKDFKESIEIIPDPTFSYQVDESLATKYLSKKGISETQRIIGLDISLEVPGLAKAVEEFKEKGFKIASWRNYSRLVDYDFSDMTPLEWGAMFSKYNIAVTDRFHATVFSLKNKIPVVTIDLKPQRIHDNGHSKASLLLNGFGLEKTNHFSIDDIKNEKMIEEVMEKAINNLDKEKIEQRLIEYEKALFRYVESTK